MILLCLIEDPQTSSFCVVVLLFGLFCGCKCFWDMTKLDLFHFLIRVDLSLRVTMWKSQEPRGVSRFPGVVSVICLAWTASAIHECLRYSEHVQNGYWIPIGTICIKPQQQHIKKAKYLALPSGKKCYQLPMAKVTSVTKNYTKEMVNRRCGTNNRIQKLCWELYVPRFLVFQVSFLPHSSFDLVVCWIPLYCGIFASLSTTVFSVCVRVFVIYWTKKERYIKFSLN